MQISADFWNALFALIGVVITIFVIPWLKSKAQTEKQKQAIVWAEQAVKCAEIAMSGKDGEAKKEFAFEYLTSKGVSENDANTLIESAITIIHAPSGNHKTKV